MSIHRHISWCKGIFTRCTPDLPPQVDLETVAILKKAIRANKAVAELKVSGRLIPNQALNVSEAKASSEIENIVTTNIPFILEA